MKKNLFKHIILFTLSLNLCILLFARPAFAFSNSNIISNVETFEDGSYIIEELQIIPDNNIISPIASTKSTTGCTQLNKIQCSWSKMLDFFLNRYISIQWHYIKSNCCIL